MIISRGRRIGPVVYDRAQKWSYDGLVGHWCPSATSPTGLQLLDISGFNSTGTLTGMDAPTDWVIRDGKYALDFDGANDYVVAGNRASLGSRFSAFGWVRKTTTQSQVQIVGQYQAATNQRSWQLATSSASLGGSANGTQLAFFASGDGTAVSNQVRGAFTTATISDGNWYHVGVVFNLGVISLYRNGTPQTNISANFTGTFTTPFATNASWSIGAYNADSGGNGFLLGQLDDIRIYNRFLTANEVQKLYAGGRGFGLLKSFNRRWMMPAASFKHYWFRNQQRMVGGGIR
jgi:hypothetical protein